MAVRSMSNKQNFIIMDLENEKVQQGQSGDQKETNREGYQSSNQYNNYSRDYRSSGRPQRPDRKSVV